jgi:hypothetical protein
MQRARAALVALTAVGALAFAAPSAHASVAANESILFPFEVVVGQTGVPASIRLQNNNSPPDAATANTVCNAGEASPPCNSPEGGIVLVPACSAISGSGQCSVAGANPGVFDLSATGTGTAGSACAGQVFEIVETGDGFGTVRFVPQPAGSHVTLPAAGQFCEIGFTLDVLKMPVDEGEFQAGVQTTAAGEHTQVMGVFGPGAPSHHVVALGPRTTVSRAGPGTVATTASPDITLGSGALTDTATVSGVTSPVAGATIDFRLFGPDDATCAGTPVFTSTKPANAAGSTVSATSDAFTPTQAGTYRWVASYSGDVNNLPASGACNDAGETTTVTVATTPPVDPAPAITAFRFSPARFTARKGAQIGLTLSEDAAVRVVIQRARPGRRAGGRCRAVSRANRKKPKCTRFVAAGAVTFAGKAGANQFKFDGRVRGRRLAAGKYRATAKATDGAGQVSAGRSAGFKIVKR